MTLEKLPPDRLIYHTFDAMRRVFIAVAGIEEIHEFDTRLFKALQEVAEGDITLFPGLADVKVAIDDDLKLTPDEVSEIAETLRRGMLLDRAIADRLLTFLRQPTAQLP